MNKTCLALVAAIAVSQCSGCCVCRRLFGNSATVAQPAPVFQQAPVCQPAPVCCPTAPCGGCDSCGGSSMGFSDQGLSYPAMGSPQVIYGNSGMPPGP